MSHPITSREFADRRHRSELANHPKNSNLEKLNAKGQMAQSNAILY
jgi:hypothetical protein